MPAELLRGVSHADYTADNLPGAPHFSRSTALTILEESMLDAGHQHPKLGGHPRQKDSKATDTGSLVHGLLLGTGPEIVKVRIHGNKAKIGPLRDAENFLTDEAKEIRDGAYARGAVPVLPGRWAEVEAMASAFALRLERLGVPLPSTDDRVIAEGTFLWEEDGVRCKCRPDLAIVRAGAAWDLKSTEKNAAAWRASMTRYGYDIQHYTAGAAIASLHPELAGRVDLQFVVLRLIPPYDAWIQPVGRTMASLGEDRWRRARKEWARCLETGEWPGCSVQEPAEARPWEQEKELVAAIAAAGEPDWTKGD